MLWEQAVIGWDVGNNNIIIRQHWTPFPARTDPLIRPPPLFVRRGKPRLFVSYIITESPVFTGLLAAGAGSFPIARRSRITPVSGSFLL